MIRDSTRLSLSQILGSQRMKEPRLVSPRISLQISLCSSSNPLPTMALIPEHIVSPRSYIPIVRDKALCIPTFHAKDLLRHSLVSIESICKRSITSGNAVRIIPKSSPQTSMSVDEMRAGNFRNARLSKKHRDDGNKNRHTND